MANGLKTFFYSNFEINNTISEAIQSNNFTTFKRKMFMFISAYLTKNQFNSQCPEGVIHKRSGSVIRTGQSAYLQHDNHGENIGYHIIGSYCPKSGKSHTFKVRIYPEGTFGIEGHPGDYDIDDSTTVVCNDDPGWKGTTTEKSGSSDFWPNLCVPFDGYLYSSDCSNSYIRITVDSSTLKSGAVSCTYRDCRPFHYGSHCENSVDEYDDENECTVNLGTSGDGKCSSCKGAKSIQPHCRKNLNTNGVIFKSREIDGTWVDQQDITSEGAQFSVYDQYYNVYKLSGSIILPILSGSIKFRVVSRTPAYLKVGNKETAQLTGDNLLNCQPEEHDSYTPEVTYSVSVSEISSVTFEIQVAFGCSLNYVDAHLEWSIDNENYVAVPAAFFYH